MRSRERVAVYVMFGGVAADAFLSRFSDGDYLSLPGGMISAVLLPLGVVLAGTLLLVRNRSWFAGKPVSLQAWVSLAIILCGHSLWLRNVIGWFSLVFALGGAILFMRAVVRSTALSEEVLHPVHPDTHPDHRRSPLRPRFSALPSFGAMYVCTIAPLIIVMALIQLPTYQSQGIWASLRTVAALGPGNDVLVLRIDARGGLFVRSKKVLPQDLGEVLKKELRRCAHDVVYLDADPDLEYQRVISATDLIRAIGARVEILPLRTKPTRR